MSSTVSFTRTAGAAGTCSGDDVCCDDKKSPRSSRKRRRSSRRKTEEKECRNPPLLYPIGSTTKKYFSKHRAWFPGTIQGYNPNSRLYKIEYEDGDQEELEHDEIDIGSLPKHKYEIGFRYGVWLCSKEDGTDLGLFEATIQSKMFIKSRFPTWIYRVVYPDGDSEDVAERAITANVERAKKDGKSTAAQDDEDATNANTNHENSHYEIDVKNVVEQKERRIVDHWSSKEHYQFYRALVEYGVGNIEAIYSAKCIPNRSFRELFRYWKSFCQDMETKGLSFDYHRRGTVNNTRGFHWNFGMQNESESGNLMETGTPEKEPQWKRNLGPWTETEKEDVVKALAFHGGSYEEMSSFMKTRSPGQIKHYYLRQKAHINARCKRILNERDDRAKKLQEERKRKQQTGPWTEEERSLLLEACNLFDTDVVMMAAYVGTRDANDIRSMLETKEGANCVDANNFNLGYFFTFPEELYHVLNIAPHKGLDQIIGWGPDGNSFQVRNTDHFRTLVFPNFSQEGTCVDHFYDTLDCFGFEQVQEKNGSLTYSHHSFRRGHIQRVKQMPLDLFSSEES